MAVANTTAISLFSATRSWVVGIVSALLIGSCSSKEQLVSLEPQEELAFAKPEHYYPKHGGLIGYFDDSTDNVEHFFFLQKDSQSLLHAAVKTRAPFPRQSVSTRTVQLNHLFNFSNRPLEALGVISPDSLVFVAGNLHGVSITDSLGRIRQQWQPRAAIYGSTEYFIDTCLEPIYCAKGLVYLRCGPEIGPIISDSTLFNKFLSYRSGLILNPHDTTLALNKTGAFPAYLSAKHNYNITGSAGCVAPNGHYLFSFGPFSELHDYDLQGHETVVDVPSRHHRPPTDLPFAALTNRQALINYKLRSPEYGRLVSDPYRRRFLRVHMHGLPVDPASAERPAYANMPWSLLIINENLEKIGEIEMSPQYDPRLIIATRHGILIGNNRPEQTAYRPTQLSFQLFTYRPIH